jgi:hypothetical protein
MMTFCQKNALTTATRTMGDEEDEGGVTEKKDLRHLCFWLYWMDFCDEDQDDFGGEGNDWIFTGFSYYNTESCNSTTNNLIIFAFPSNVQTN